LRDAHFLLGLDKAGADFIAADMPNANRLTVGFMAMVAEEDRRMISARTKAALAAAKARGTKLGGNRGVKPTAKMRALSTMALQQRADARAADIGPTIKALQVAGATNLRAIAAGLNEQGIPTARGGAASLADLHLHELGENLRAAANRAMASCWASIPRPLLPCFPVDNEM
jgi:hypothetical protein